MLSGFFIWSEKGGNMKTLITFGLAILLALSIAGCTTGLYRQPQAIQREFPSGPGTIPPSWYDYDPAYGHWFDPWYVNPYTSL